MIVDIIISAILITLTWIFGLFPSLPPVPASFLTATDWLILQIGNVSGIFSAIYGQVLFSAIIASIILLFAFESVYHVTIWVIRKLPFSIN